MVFNATFNNISFISWQSVLLVEETGENHRPVTSHWQTLSHNVVHLTLIEIRTSMVIGTDCVGSCKSNYHTITITTAPKLCLLFRSYRLNQLINLSTARPPLFISSSDILFWYLLSIICKENEWIFSKFKISKFEVTIRLIKCYFMIIF